MWERSVAWLVALPLAAAAWLSAHCLAYLLVPPAPEGHAGLHGEHMGLHAESGHAYLGYTPALLAFGLTLAVVGFGLCIRQGLRGGRVPRPPVRLFALLPPVGFTVQEHLEQAIGSGRSRSISSRSRPSWSGWPFRCPSSWSRCFSRGPFTWSATGSAARSSPAWRSTAPYGCPLPRGCGDCRSR